MPTALYGLLDVERVGPRVTRHLERFTTRRLSAVSADGWDRALVSAVADLVLADGKRLRAALCYWGWRAAGGPPSEDPIAAAAAMELLHGLALIHDDVMDHAMMRRGRPTVHQSFSELHARQRWRGAPAEFGVAAAILAGDLCAVWSDMVLNDSGLSDSARRRAASTYDAMRHDAIRGQFLDLVGDAGSDHSPQLARAIASGKTASSTTTGPVLFGAQLAGASAGVVAGLRDYAEPLGLAFQLRDDLLDAFGDTTRTGKPTGQDLRDGKATLLLAVARRRGGPRLGSRIDALIDLGNVEELRKLLQVTGARHYVAREIQLLTERAIAALDASLIPGDPAAMLCRLAHAATGQVLAVDEPTRSATRSGPV